MIKITALLIISAFCSLTVDAFLFNEKFVDGCRPNPCKNRGVCIKDSNNPNISTCACDSSFHGKHCELKTGCSLKKCRKGTCTNDPLNLSDYKCHCAQGFLGKNCDLADPCAKNPCKNNGKCSLDSKLRPQCACKIGFGDKLCDKRNCSIREYKGKHFAASSPKVLVDEKIMKKMDDLDSLAKHCRVRLYAVKSFVLHHDPKTGNFLDPKDKTNPNHYVGQALSVHIYDEEDKLACNDVCLGRSNVPHKGARCFLDGLIAINWTWSITNPSVVSTNFHLGNTATYNNLRELHQVGCRLTKF